MKIITRTLIIIAAGLLVTGGLLAFGQSSLGTQMREAGPRGGHFEGRERPPFGFGGQAEGQPQGTFQGEGRPEGSFGGRGEGHFEGRGEGRNTPSLGGLPEIIKNLVKIGLIVTLFVLGARLLGGGRKDRPAKA
jgi:hypothetical protein